MENEELPQYMRIAGSVAGRIAEGQFAEGDEALAALLELELAGLAQSCAGGQYRRK